MGKAEKILDKMRNNPRDWRIDSLKSVARGHGIKWRQHKTSHVTFRHPNGAKLTVPAHRPIKPIYIMKFVHLVEVGTGDKP